MLKKVKSYIDNHLNPAKVNIIDPRKKFVQPLNIPEILAELQITDDYYGAVSISKVDGLELHLKRKPNSCLVNNCFGNVLTGKYELPTCFQ